MNYKYILFDLDGTITESAPGITNSVYCALTRMGYEVKDRSGLLRFIGPPLTESMQTFYNMNMEDAQKAVEYYREYYKDKGIFENALYEGLTETLDRLKKDGKIMAVATSKPEKFAKQIAEHFGFSGYFTEIFGASMDASRIEKADVIQYALESLGVGETEKASVLMVGDRKHDIEGAKKNGLDSMGVLYGYGNRNELEEAGADYIASTTADVANIILNEKGRKRCGKRN